MQHGMFDLHVHSAPCVMPRLADDIETVEAYEVAGFRGCVLKGHCEPTVGRAAAAAAGRRTAVYGGIVLNQPAGGLNPAAVAAALAMGARIVWLPTVDARHHRQARLSHPSSCAPALPLGPGYATPPIDDEAEAAARTIIRLVAEADAVLATGHVGADEIGWISTEAARAGLRRLLLTHPSFTVPNLSAGEVRQLCERGAFAEVTAYQLLHQPGMDAGRLATFIGQVGYEHCVLSSDAGQPNSPPGPDALLQLVEALAAEGLDRAALDSMASDIPERLVTPS